MDHVSIKPDLTKPQQQEDLKLREEAKSLNLARPSDERGPFLWKVVGCPGHSSRRMVKNYLPVHGSNRIPLLTRPAITHLPVKPRAQQSQTNKPPKLSMSARATEEVENQGSFSQSPVMPLPGQQPPTNEWTTATAKKRPSSSQQPDSPSQTQVHQKPRNSSPIHDKSFGSQRLQLSPGVNFQVLSQD